MRGGITPDQAVAVPETVRFVQFDGTHRGSAVFQTDVEGGTRNRRTAGEHDQVIRLNSIIPEC